MDKATEMNSRIIRIKLIDGTSLNGYVNINKEPGYDRLSDMVGSSKENFLVVFNATVYKAELENPSHHEVMFINKRHIIWAAPDDDQK